MNGPAGSQRPWWADIPKLPKVEEVAEPASGTAELTWHGGHYGKIVVGIKAGPWHRTGIQPFAWDFVEATGRQRAPSWRIAVARGVGLTQVAIGRDGRRQQMRAGHSPKAAGLVRGFPFIYVFRPQDDALLPDPDDVFEVHRIVGEPFEVRPQPSGNRGIDAVKTVHVSPFEAGANLGHARGGYQLSIRPDDLSKPVAYAYSVSPDELTFSPVLRVVHTRGVDVHLRAHEGFKDFVTVRTCRVSSVSDVPPQGAELAEDRFRFRGHAIDDLVPSRSTLAVITAIEIAISLIPVVGTLYDIAQLAYASATGKSFWGHEVGDAELAIMGTALSISLIPGAKAATKAVRGLSRGTRLADGLTDDAIEVIRQVTDRGYLDAVGTLSVKDAEDLARLLARHLADARTTPIAALVQRLNDKIADAYLASIERRLLAKVFSEDFTGFRHAGLAAQYRKYLSARRFVKNPGRALDPAKWAKRQAAAVRGLPNQLLRRELGDDFVGVINRALAAKRLPSPVTAADIKTYDAIVAKGVQDYGTLSNLARRHGGLGGHFEIDHLLEQRFWRNNPALETAFDEKGLGMAFLVPKNAAVARSMYARFGGRRIRYVHTLKTRGIRQLIPNGSEAYFTVQQIWDAHVHVLRSLGADPSLYHRLAQDFRLMADELGQPFTRRIPPASIFRRENGWPQLIQDADGTWTSIVVKGRP